MSASDEYGGQAGLVTYTVTGLIDRDSRELLVSGVYEGHLVSVCDSASGPAGYERWAGTYEAASWQDAERTALRDWNTIDGEFEVTTP